jgi:hypothetical protein
MIQENSERSIVDDLTRPGSVFDARRWTAIPNPTWALAGLAYEADLVVISSAGWAQEIEVKVSAADLRSDAKKGKHRGLHTYGDHLWRHAQRFWYAVPTALIEQARATVVGKPYGVIEVCFDKELHRNIAEVRVKAPRIASATKCPDEVVRQALRGISLRYWDLRHDRHKEV